MTGRCHPCGRVVDLLVDYQFSWTEDGVLTPNWRERLVCPDCGLNARMRATIHLLEEVVRAPAEARAYITEQTTPLYAWARGRFRSVVGSEWLGDGVALGGANASGIRNEDLTRLSFPRGAFDLIVCLDVLEHVPDFQGALRECLRVLAPGGALFLTCPFRVDLQQNLVRAVLRADGTVEHRLPPEYHGNPLSMEGSLAFYHFGWELLEQMNALGFADVRAQQYWSRDFGYLGRELLVFLARKPPRASYWQRLRGTAMARMRRID